MNKLIVVLFIALLSSVGWAEEWERLEIAPLEIGENLRKLHPDQALISGNGQQVIFSFGATTYAWHPEQGYHKLGDFYAHKINDLGTAIYGAEKSGAVTQHSKTYYWHHQRGIVALLPDNPSLNAVILDMDDQGETLVGYVWNENCTKQDVWPMKAFIWHNDEMKYLDAGTRAIGISGDGQKVLIQKNDWQMDDLCPVSSYRYRNTSLYSEPYALTIKDFLGELSFDEHHRNTKKYVKNQTGIKFKEKNIPKKKVLTGIWHKDTQKVDWLGEYYPVEISNNGEKILLASYHDPNDYLAWRRFLLWRNGTITEKGLLPEKSLRNSHFMKNSQLPIVSGYFLEGQPERRSKACTDALGASKDGSVYLCAIKEFARETKTYIIEHDQMTTLLNDWIRQKNIVMDATLNNRDDFYVFAISDDGKTWVGYNQSSRYSKPKVTKIFMIRQKDRE